MKTIDRIRKVAKKLFLERGFKKVSIREIAEKAEVPIILEVKKIFIMM